VQSSISYSGGKKLMDIRKVNYVTLGGDNAGATQSDIIG
jgi:GMP reductase